MVFAVATGSAVTGTRACRISVVVATFAYDYHGRHQGVLMFRRRWQPFIIACYQHQQQQRQQQRLRQKTVKYQRPLVATMFARPAESRSSA